MKARYHDNGEETEHEVETGEEIPQWLTYLFLGIFLVFVLLMLL